MTIYLDAVWLLNLMIDFMLFKMTSIILKRPVHPFRLAIGTLVASSIVCFLFTPLSPFFYNPLGKFLFSLLIVFIVFGYRKFFLFVQSFLTFYFSAFMIGGGLFAAHYFFESSQSYAPENLFSTLSYGDPISWIFVVVGFPILWYFSKKRLDHLVIRKWQGSQQVKTEIIIMGKTITVKGLIDSGNKLYDPLTRTPVMFLSYSGAQGVLPKCLFEGWQNQYSVAQSEITKDLASRITMIPYQTVSGGQQFITAVRPDNVYIHHEGKTIQSPKVVIALTNTRLSGEGDFHCILHPDMMLKGKTVESAS
ncbi:stage II sporulation protein GA (sporulation sigma-E factor processing peptidase) [Scopulibacillus daqui]|uniref:Sporulation sigma-E factor-processing peptidase n=1 Tax=Scopulibacillus daqui TaxID=1469162 RepID=A0ABS2PWD3_9BACL|nr:sigma-E processing peptidase SpoIIGA [Scopulibacillus daqui]MBM7644273.1 stage II sporulation protein GA (sporulation sigma-E factor processing peptidase) [Scopulibacillus daqui]